MFPKASPARGTNFVFTDSPRVPLPTRLAHVAASGGRAAVDFTQFPGAPPSRHLILQMEVLLSKHRVGRRLSQPKSDISDFGRFKCRTRVNPSSVEEGAARVRRLR